MKVVLKLRKKKYLKYYILIYNPYKYFVLTCTVLTVFELRLFGAQPPPNTALSYLLYHPSDPPTHINNTQTIPEYRSIIYFIYTFNTKPYPKIEIIQSDNVDLES